MTLVYGECVTVLSMDDKGKSCCLSNIYSVPENTEKSLVTVMQDLSEQ